MIILESIIFTFLILVAQSVSHQLTIQNHQITSGSSSVTLSHDQTSSEFQQLMARIVGGPVLFFASFVIIWLNQKRAAIDDRRLKLGKQICETVDVTNEASARSKDGQLIYANGVTRTSAIIEQKLSGVSEPNLIKITRKVEVLQWRKHSCKQQINLIWVQGHIQKSGQRYNNRANWFIQNDVTYNQQVYLGGYKISKQVADLCNKSLAVTPNMNIAQNILAKTGSTRRPTLDNQYIYFPPPNSDNISEEGTLRVKYILCHTGLMSLIGQSSGLSFSKFNIAKYEGTQHQSSGANCCDFVIDSKHLTALQQILQVRQSTMIKDEIFDECIFNKRKFSCMMRILGFVFMVSGLLLIFQPLINLLNHIPFIGLILGKIIGFTILIAIIIICIPLWLITISIAWIFYRPKIGLIMLGIGLVILSIFLFVGRNKAGSDQTSTATMSHFLTLQY